MRRKSFYPLFGLFLGILSVFFIPSAQSAPEKDKKEPYIVILDPGHGGKDVGTKSRLKKTIFEKNIALAIAIRTAKILRDPKYIEPLGRPLKVLMTRTKDKNLSLEDRSELAQTQKANLFVSIHTNSDPAKKASGLETYFLNNTDNESSSKLEQIENKSSKKYAHARPTSLLIRSIAADAVVDASKEAAETIHQSIADHLRHNEISFHDRGVRQAMFYVLLDAQVPAILLEAFFLSHPKDLAFISKPENRQLVAEGLAKGILRVLALQ